jgi:CRP/FNR family transcriptional regulator
MSTRHIPIVICRNCALYNTARVLGLESPDCSTLDEVVIRNHPIDRGQQLFSTGDPVRYLYLVHSGSCISYEEGEPRKVMSFYLPGEIVGVEDIGETHHSHTAAALENGSLCQLDFTHLESSLSPEELIRVQRYLLRATALHARQLQQERLITGLPSAEQRIAAFLLNLGHRFHSHGLPALTYRLPMSRDEIANYLGLAPETVIRILKKLGSRKLVSIRTRQVEILDPTALEQLSAA